MKHYKHYLVLAVIVLVALGVLFRPAFFQRYTSNQKYRHHVFPAMQSQTTDVEKIDFDTFDTKKMHTVVEKQRQDQRVISIKEITPVRHSASLISSWVVRIGNFDSENKALAVSVDLRQRGFSAFVLSQQGAQQQTNWHVFLGPMLTKSRAKSTLASVKQQTHYPASIVAYDISKMKLEEMAVVADDVKEEPH